ncbi:MAG: hypothetical protein OXC19_02215 [Bryobacterales bacterium]|nr:hypothetical protein [Bryobacterales bacterium]
MRLALPPSRHFDPANVEHPEQTGEVDWSRFNANFERLLGTSWRDVNRDVDCGLPLRLLRLALAFQQQRRSAILDLEGKLRVFSRLKLPPNPDIVHFGAEIGWEAAILQALFGDRGRVLLIDSDPMAYQRFLRAPRSSRVRVPRSRKRRWIDIHRNPERITYAREDFYRVRARGEFDVGIDWGLIEHYDDTGKESLISLFRTFLKPGGVQICSCPRNRLAVRLFYRAFADELNLGYRELMTIRELSNHVERNGCVVEAKHRLPAHNIIVYRAPELPADAG